MKKYYFPFIYLLCAWCIPIWAQTSSPQQPLAQPTLPDSADICYYATRNWKIASGEIVGINAALAGYNRFIKKADYGYINFKTMEQNLRHGFVWDNDEMFTNMFGHPYHGSLYYNAARSNGYNYWQSAAFSLGGSTMWELFLENEYPSINDIIATPVGGIVIGEVLFSTSDLILDDRARGTERFGREFASFLVAPTRGLTRIITGDAWKHRRTSGKQYGMPPIAIDISTGMRSLSLKDKFWKSDVVWTTNINVEYGDRFDTDNKIPYDYFTVKASFNSHSSQPALGKLDITARLHGLDLTDTQKDYLNIGFYQYYMYYDSDSISGASARVPFRFAAPASFGGGAMYQNKRWAPNYTFDAYAHLCGIMLGMSLSDHYKAGLRNYNMGSGLGLRGGFRLGYKDVASISAAYQHYRIFTWKGYPDNVDWSVVDPKSFNTQGDKSHSSLTALSLTADVKLMQKLYLTAASHFYSRKTHYAQYTTVATKAQEGSLMLTYRF